MYLFQIWFFLEVVLVNRFVSEICRGEKCRCGKDAEHKVEEAAYDDDPFPFRIPLVTYICHDCFVGLMGPAAGRTSGA